MSWFVEPLLGFNALDTLLGSGCQPYCGCQTTLFTCVCTGGLVIIKPPELR